MKIEEIFNLTLQGSFENQPKRALIGSVAVIGEEAEEVINDLLAVNDIDYEIDTFEYPYILAPNFQGINLFDAIYYLLNKKNKTMFFEDETLTIIKRDSDSFESGAFINDTPRRSIREDIQLYEYEREENLFDLRNDITVYGSSVKANRKDFKSIKQFGQKSLEVYEYNLATQEAVNERAVELLNIYSRLNQKITISVGHKGVSQLKAGDIIEL